MRNEGNKYEDQNLLQAQTGTIEEIQSNDWSDISNEHAISEIACNLFVRLKVYEKPFSTLSSVARKTSDSEIALTSCRRGEPNLARGKAWIGRYRGRLQLLEALLQYRQSHEPCSSAKGTRHRQIIAIRRKCGDLENG